MVDGDDCCEASAHNENHLCPLINEEYCVN